MKPSKSPLSIFLSTGANLKIIEKKADLWGPKNRRPFWLKKKFFLTFLCWDDLKVFLKQKQIFLKKFFLNFLLSLTANIKAAPPPPVINKDQKVPCDIFICNVEKFELLA